MKEVVQHKDVLGRDINIDDCVVFPASNSLVVGKVVKINPKMIKVEKVPATKYGSTWNKYPQDTAKVDGPEVTMYLLKG